MKLLSLSDWINLLLSGFQTLQEALLQLLALLGLTSFVHGQPAWPFAQRLSGAVMLIDHSVARQLLYALGFSVVALAALTLALLWRRGRVVMLLLSVVLVWFTPWPDPQLLLAPATPASFHVSRSGFSAAAIVHGEQLYQQRCADCHGVDGKGDTPLGLSLPLAPPNLASALLWRRADGDLFWHIANGMQDRQGASTMPGFVRQLGDQDIWALIDFMKANAAGTSIRDTGGWDQPVALPAWNGACSNGSARGQRVRVILASPQQPQRLPFDDPRLHSVILANGALAAPAAQAGAPVIDCVARSADAWQALSIITGVPADQLAGTQLLTDRDGWLRARKTAGDRSGNADWSQSDIVCHAQDAAQAGSSAAGLDGLIAAIDAEPVWFVKGGLVHTGQ